MIDMEKVIKDLEHCLSSKLPHCYKCDRYGDVTNDNLWSCKTALMREALELLKEQEPRVPHLIDWGIYECPVCKTRVDYSYRYCKHCGQAVKWCD